MARSSVLPLEGCILSSFLRHRMMGSRGKTERRLLRASPPYAKNSAGRVLGGTLIQVDCTHPGQDGEGAHTPCNDRNLYPKYRFYANYGLANYNYIDADANTGIIDMGPSVTIAGKQVCKFDPANSAAIDCPTVRDYTITLAAPPAAYSIGQTYEIGSLLVAVNSNNPLVNTYYVPKDCNVSRIDYTETAATGAVPSPEQSQVTIFVNGSTPLSSPLSMSWSGAGQNHLGQSLTPSVALHTGDQITFQVITPYWTTPPSGTVAVTAVLYCQVS